MIKKMFEIAFTFMAIVFTFLTFISFCNIFKTWQINVLGQAVLTIFLLCIALVFWYVAQYLHDENEEN